MIPKNPRDWIDIFIDEVAPYIKVLDKAPDGPLDWSAGTPYSEISPHLKSIPQRALPYLLDYLDGWAETLPRHLGLEYFRVPTKTGKVYYFFWRHEHESQETCRKCRYDLDECDYRCCTNPRFWIGEG